MFNDKIKPALIIGVSLLLLVMIFFIQEKNIINMGNKEPNDIYEIQSIYTSKSYVYINDKNTLIVKDKFDLSNKEIDNDVSFFSNNNSYIVYSKQNKLYLYNLAKSIITPLSIHTDKEFFMSDTHLFFSNKNSLYKMNLSTMKIGLIYTFDSDDVEIDYIDTDYIICSYIGDNKYKYTVKIDLYNPENYTILFSDTSDIFVYENHIYGINKDNILIRTSSDYQNIEELPYKITSKFYIANNEWYYISDNNSLVKINSQNNIKVLLDKISDFCIINDTIYYVSMDSTIVGKYNIKDGRKSEVIKDMNTKFNIRTIN